MINLTSFSSIFIANWKLNGNKAFIKEYYQKLSPGKGNCVIVCSPNIYLSQLYSNNKNIFSGAQDISKFIEGAYTGELSSIMLKDFDINFCIVGHSERRKYFNEVDQSVNLKSSNLIKHNIVPVICIGETLEEKEKGITKDVLKKQIENGIPDNSSDLNTIIAYEPIWAIGTGLTPTLNEIDEVHETIRNFDLKFKNFKILYGGSVKSSNSADINKLKNVNGCLVGGASLDFNEFNIIIS